MVNDISDSVVFGVAAVPGPIVKDVLLKMFMALESDSADVTVLPERLSEVKQFTHVTHN